MTTAEKLAEVTAQIRKDIPRLMEFREGCIIESSGEMFKVIHIFENYPERICLINLENKAIYSGKFTYPVDRLGSFVTHPYKVIGHEITLLDVFQWLFMNDDLHDIRHIFIDGTLIPKSGIIDYSLHINFDSPYLKNQPTIFIDFLYNISK